MPINLYLFYLPTYLFGPKKGATLTELMPTSNVILFYMIGILSMGQSYPKIIQKKLFKPLSSKNIPIPEFFIVRLSKNMLSSNQMWSCFPWYFIYGTNKLPQNNTEKKLFNPLSSTKNILEIFIVRLSNNEPSQDWPNSK